MKRLNVSFDNMFIQYYPGDRLDFLTIWNSDNFSVISVVY